MIRIYRGMGGEAGEFVVQTTCLDTDSFIGELAEALTQAIQGIGADADIAALGILQSAMPIAYKLSGYKSETVVEQRTLLCGRVSPSSSDLICTSGR